ncbi:hypothetical protein KC332_g87 [Hortaea werneckii]|nr:hypothetical protein KC332_g87 [Hortaea werneckii]
MEPPNRIPNPLRQLRILQQTIRAGSIKRRHTHIHTPKRKNPPQPLRPKELPRPRPDGLEGVQRNPNTAQTLLYPPTSQSPTSYPPNHYPSQTPPHHRNGSDNSARIYAILPPQPQDSCLVRGKSGGRGGGVEGGRVPGRNGRGGPGRRADCSGRRSRLRRRRLRGRLGDRVWGRTL